MVGDHAAQEQLVEGLAPRCPQPVHLLLGQHAGHRRVAVAAVVERRGIVAGARHLVATMLPAPHDDHAGAVKPEVIEAFSVTDRGRQRPVSSRLLRVLGPPR